MANIIENKSNYVVIETETEYQLYSYKSHVCDIAKCGHMGFDGLIRFGRDWNYSKTTKKHINQFLNTYGCGTFDIPKSIERGFVYGKTVYCQNIAVIYDKTM